MLLKHTEHICKSTHTLTYTHTHVYKSLNLYTLHCVLGVRWLGENERERERVMSRLSSTRKCSLVFSYLFLLFYYLIYSHCRYDLTFYFISDIISSSLSVFPSLQNLCLDIHRLIFHCELSFPNMSTFLQEVF